MWSPLARGKLAAFAFQQALEKRNGFKWEGLSWPSVQCWAYLPRPMSPGRLHDIKGQNHTQNLNILFYPLTWALLSSLKIWGRLANLSRYFCWGKLLELYISLGVHWVSTWSTVTFCLRPSMSGFIHLPLWAVVGHEACQCNTSAKALCMHYSILNVDSRWPFCPRRPDRGGREKKIPWPRTQLHRL